MTSTTTHDFRYEMAAVGTLRDKVFRHAQDLARQVAATIPDNRPGFVGEIEDTKRAVEAVAIQPEVARWPEMADLVAEDDANRKLINAAEDMARSALSAPDSFVSLWRQLEPTDEE